MDKKTINSMKKWEENQDHKRKKLLTDKEIENVFLPIISSEKTEENFIDFLKKIVNHVHKIVKKEKMDNEYIDNYVGKLSARELISNGKTFYMNPCLDLALVTIEWLKKSGIKSKLVIQELLCTGNRITLHFWIEIILNNIHYYIDNKSRNVSIIGKGIFKNNNIDEKKEQIHISYISDENISTDDNIETLINKKLINLLFFDADIFNNMKELYKRSNTQEKREHRYKNEIKNKEYLEIIVR